MLTILTVITINLILRLCSVFTFWILTLLFFISLACLLARSFVRCLALQKLAIRLLSQCTSTVTPVHAMTVYGGGDAQDAGEWQT